MTHNRKSLEADWRAGNRSELILFWGHTPQKDGRVSNACYSQWYVSPFEVDRIVYPTTEHWMMAGKARLCGDEEALIAILAAPAPVDAKALGRKVRNFDAVRWDDAKRRIVYEGNVAKFTQHAALGAHLMNTGEAVLVEASPYDKIWGIGLGRDNPAALDPATWQGENLLGFVLMDVRDKLRQSN